MKNPNELYGKELLCKCCGHHQFRLLLNVYSSSSNFIMPNIEVCCLKCCKGVIILPNSNKQVQKLFDDLKNNVKTN